MTAAIRHCFSPEGPIQAISASFPHSLFKISSVSQASLPHRWEASRSSALPLSITRYRGLEALPVKKTAS